MIADTSAVYNKNNTETTNNKEWWFKRFVDAYTYYIDKFVTMRFVSTFLVLFTLLMILSAKFNIKIICSALLKGLFVFFYPFQAVFRYITS